MIFDYAGAVGVVAAVWSSLFLGTDYSDGTLRNNQGLGDSTPDAYPDIHTVDQAIATVDRSPHFYHAVFIDHRIDLRHPSLAGFTSRKRRD